MSQNNPGPWGQSDPQGRPPQPYPGQGGYPPQGPGPQGYPPPGPGPVNYPPQGPPGPPGYGQPPYGAQQPYRPQPGFPGQGGPYPPQGFGPQGPQGTPPKKKSPLLIIGIVVAALVALVAIGGIAIALSSGGDDTVPDTTITPGQPTAPPTDQPTTEPSSSPSSKPSASSQPASPAATPGQSGGSAISLGNGISVTPASGWSVRKKTSNVAQLSDGDSLFLGQTVKIDKGTNPGQLCTAWHKQIAEGTSGGKFADPKTLDLGSRKLKGASCAAEVTVSSGQGSSKVLLVTVTSVRQSDGVTVLGTVYFTSAADEAQLNKDFSSMVNSMLRTQVQGG
jgi:hypothetical protein